MARGKKYKKAVELITSESYNVKDAVELLEKTNTVKFDPSVEVHFNLNLDPKYADQMIRTTINLPHRTYWWYRKRKSFTWFWCLCCYSYYDETFR